MSWRWRSASWPSTESQSAPSCPKTSRVCWAIVQLQQVFLNLIINRLEAMSAVQKDRRVLYDSLTPRERKVMAKVGSDA
jgi:C4-dicarboxylate-specific signal transduction histidine kinase